MATLTALLLAPGLQALGQEATVAADANPPAAELPPPASPVPGDYETLTTPGFVVHYVNCDGSAPVADRLTLPRRLSSRYTDMEATVRVSLQDGVPGDIQLVEGAPQLLEAVHWHVERARFAAGDPACVLLHYRVADTVLKASEIVDFRVWVDVQADASGEISAAEVAEPLADESVARAIVGQVASWSLPPMSRGGEPVPFSTSLRVAVKLLPSSWTGYEMEAELLRSGPRPVTTTSPRWPRRVTTVARRGSVVMEFYLDAEGRPIDPEVVESSPAGVFDRYALAAIRRWRYRPLVLDGEPVPSGPVREVMEFDAGYQEEPRRERRSLFTIGGD
ncbi:MAG: energy transducer TonB [Gammaproteobacteria bacterium]